MEVQRLEGRQLLSTYPLVWGPVGPPPAHPVLAPAGNQNIPSETNVTVTSALSSPGSSTAVNTLSFMPGVPGAKTVIYRSSDFWDWSYLATAPAGATSYQDTVNAGQPYWYDVYTELGNVISGQQVSLDWITGGVPATTPPSPQISLVYEPYTDPVIGITFPYTTAYYYNVMESTNDGASFTDITSVGADVWGRGDFTFAFVNNLTAGQTAEFMLTTTNGQNVTSAGSNTVTISPTTIQTSLTASEISTNFVSLSWSAPSFGDMDPNNPVKSYTVYSSNNAGQSYVALETLPFTSAVLPSYVNQVPPFNISVPVVPQAGQTLEFYVKPNLTFSGTTVASNLVSITFPGTNSGGGSPSTPTSTPTPTSTSSGGQGMGTTNSGGTTTTNPVVTRHERQEARRALLIERRREEILRLEEARAARRHRVLVGLKRPDGRVMVRFHRPGLPGDFAKLEE